MTALAMISTAPVRCSERWCGRGILAGKPVAAFTHTKGRDVHFELTDDERMIRDTARELAEKEFAPKASKYDETCEFPQENVDKLAELGFMGMCVEERWGGAGLSGLAYAVAMEEISRACASTGVIMSVQNSLVCDPIQKFGNDAQKETYLRPLAQGQKIGAYCLTEPEAGSDAQNQRTSALRDGDHYVLN